MKENHSTSLALSLVLLLLAILFTAAPLPASAAGDFTVSAAVENETVFVGESFIYQVQVDGEDAPEQPDLSSLSDFSVEFIGGQQNSSTSVTIINGRMTQDVKRGYIFNWRLTPKRAGMLEIPPVTVTAGGRSARSNPVRIRAAKPTEMDDFKLELSLSKESAWVGEPVTLTATWYIGQNVEQFRFNLPVLSDPRFAVADWDMPVDPNRQDRYLAVPLADGQTVGIKEQRRLGSRDYTTLRFQKVIIPKTAGTLTLDEATVSFLAVTGYRNPGHRSMFDDFFNTRQAVTRKYVIPSNAVPLAVRPLPEAGRPDNFNGLVGEYRIEATAEPTTVKVGDPITLTLRVSGPDYLDPVWLPPLDAVPELAHDFKIPPDIAPGTIEGNAKVFTQTVRAAHANVTAIPAIPLPYFDATAGEYRIAKSEPIPLKVSATRVVTAMDAEGIAPDGGPARSELETWAGGIAYNYEDISVLRDRAAGPAHWAGSPFWIAWLAGFPAMYALVFGFTAYRHSRRANPEYYRRRKAYAVLAGQLNAIRPSGPEAGKETAAGVLSAFRDYLAVKLSLPPGGRTWRDIEAALKERNLSGERLGEVKTLFDTCEAIGYGGIGAAGSPGGNLVDRADALAKQLERSLS